ncbi:MAG: histidine ammonia-lyase [Synergistetes bacterium]|nr:histidine ammonia-lyase [Synergistota bacterium]MCX8127209.1 histidine ammonia-lyase [Synergistota bacterium]MDW8191905.1 histidine ammonia-lyase [Synergistota bacterium]
MKEVVIDGENLRIEDFVKVAKYGWKVRIASGVKEKVDKSRRVVEEAISSKKIIYGITTGFGDLAKVAIPTDKIKELQRNLVRSHACGVGDPFPPSIVKGAMLLRLNALAKGYSGVRYEILEFLAEMINRDICPYVPMKGSVGASGDLAPLAHIALAMMGEGNVFYKGKLLPASLAFKEELLPPIVFDAKEGLALINGTSMMASVGGFALYEASKILKLADVSLSLSIEALKGIPDAFDLRIHRLRPHPGQEACASNVLKLIEGSEIIYLSPRERTQDAYSIRCAPQVHGAARDALSFLRGILEREFNSVTDNPLVFPEDKEILSGGNFHGEPLAIGMDLLSIALSEVANISERRVARLVDGHLSNLPDFLIFSKGLNSGFMIPQYVAAALVSENKVLAHPAAVDSIPTSANQEDHVSMGMNSGLKLLNIIDNVYKVLAIEMLVACQGIDFRSPLKPGKGTIKAYSMIREEVPFLVEDSPLYIDISKVEKILKGDLFLEEVEGAVNGLF